MGIIDAFLARINANNAEIDAKVKKTLHVLNLRILAFMADAYYDGNNIIHL
jgi:hypothetical protein